MAHRQSKRLEMEFERRRLQQGTGARVPHFYKRLSAGAPWVEKQRTRNWPNCTGHHESAHQNDKA